MTSLYKLADEYRELENMDLDAETLADTLESINGEFDAKADAICHVLANLEANTIALYDECDRLKERASKFGIRHDGLKDYLRVNMEKLGKKKIESAKFTISCVKGRDKVNVLDESKLSGVYFMTIPASKTLNKKLLLDDLKGGGEFKEIEGAELIKSKSSLRIK
jgi:hypothetical protein